MTQVEANLRIEEGGTPRNLRKDDFHVDETGAAKEISLQSALTVLAAIRDNTDDVEATLTGIGLNTDEIEQALADLFAELAQKLEAGEITGLATAARQDTIIARTPVPDFKRVLKFEPIPGEEIRRDEQTSDDYHGVAPDGSLITDAVWTVVRFYKTAGKITRVRYRTGVAWDSRTAGW